ncbi:MAG: Phenylalanine--tRNA ligase beta subunit [Candidatus Omnitrophica bacterium ADurb.Bin205]|nr:MAG: Phenylalanine--tRNA ligase beta subunit [Candidatus Omnitrophica bacterium ADurb.Bin205]
MFELGEPLHAFDLDKIKQNKIFVRRGLEGEKLVTIDGLLRDIDKNSLVIADAAKPLALAGIMGGKESEVTYATKNILLEAAIFNPILIRRQRQLQGIQSESSYRFERGVDQGIVGEASSRAAQLIADFCSGKDEGLYSSGLAKAREKLVTLSPISLEKISGLNIKATKVKKILSCLGFKVKAKGKGLLSVSVPSFRQDVCLEEDLIEEVTRIYGYEHIPVTIPKILPTVTIKDSRALVSGIKNILIGLGLSEAITYSLIDKKTLKDFAPLSNPIELLNPLSQDQEVLRTTLIPGLARAIAHNLNQKQDCVALFECAGIFLEKDGLPCQETSLGIALSGAKKMLLNDSAVKDELGMLNLKGIVETLLNRLGIKGYEFVSDAHIPKADIHIGSESVGSMQMLSQELLDLSGIKGKNVFVAELSLDKIFIFSRMEKKYSPLPKYPEVVRDVSFILKKEESVKNILITLKERGHPLLRKLRVVDYYNGKQIPQGYRGLTLELVYASSERTLTEEDVAPVHANICSALKEEFGAQMR